MMTHIHVHGQRVGCAEMMQLGLLAPAIGLPAGYVTVTVTISVRVRVRVKVSVRARVRLRHPNAS
jgi:hypothetical protein